MIYFAQAECGGPIKVGFSVRPVMRVAGLSKALRVLSVRHGSIQEERAIHERLKADCLGGEWYAETDAVLDEATKPETVEPSSGENIQRQLYALLPELLEAAFPDRSHASIAKEIGVSSKIVGYWLSGYCVPGTPHMIALGQVSPLIKQFILGYMATSDVGLYLDHIQKLLTARQK